MSSGRGRGGRGGGGNRYHGGNHNGNGNGAGNGMNGNGNGMTPRQPNGHAAAPTGGAAPTNHNIVPVGGHPHNPHSHAAHLNMNNGTSSPSVPVPAVTNGHGNSNGNGHGHVTHNHNHGHGGGGAHRSPNTSSRSAWRVPPSIGGTASSSAATSTAAAVSSNAAAATAASNAAAAHMAMAVAAAAANNNNGLPAGYPYNMTGLPGAPGLTPGLTPPGSLTPAQMAASMASMGIPMGYPGTTPTWPPTAATSPYFAPNPAATAAAAYGMPGMTNPFFNPYAAAASYPYTPAAMQAAQQAQAFQMYMAAAAAMTPTTATTAATNPYLSMMAAAAVANPTGGLTNPSLHLPLPLPLPTPTATVGTPPTVMPTIPTITPIVPTPVVSVPAKASAAPTALSSSPPVTPAQPSTSSSSSTSPPVSGVASLTAAVAGLSMNDHTKSIAPTNAVATVAAAAAAMAAAGGVGVIQGMSQPVLNGTLVAGPISGPMLMSKIPVQPGAPPYYALDVECIATGPRHDQRAVGQIALLDEFERVQLNLYVRPADKVASYLPALTGLSEDICNTHGIPLELAKQYVKAHLPANAILVGQGILKDVQWLGLEEGKDFGGLMDLAGLWRTFNPKFKNYSYFSLHHKSKCILNIEQQEPHSPVIDALLSIRLFNAYKSLEHNPQELQRKHEVMLSTPVSESFAAKHPVYEGCCMGYKKSCKCGAPFFYG